MTGQELTITYRRQLSGTGAPLFLEQGEPEIGTGIVTGSAVVSALLSSLTGSTIQAPKCGGWSGAEFDVDIFAYPADPLFNYDFGLSWGSFSKRIIEEVTIPEIVSFKMTDQELLKYPSKRLLSVEWLGDCFDAAGGIVTQDLPTLAGQILAASRKCYGSALVLHRVIRHRYNCTIPMRESAAENAWTSQPWAVWRSGYDWLEIQQPDGLDDDENPCYGGSNVKINPKDRGRSIPKYAWADQDITVDYCSQKAGEPSISGREEWGWENR